MNTQTRNNKNRMSAKKKKDEPLFKTTASNTHTTVGTTANTGYWSYPGDDNDFSIGGYPSDTTPNVNITLSASAGEMGLPEPTKENCIIADNKDFFVNRMEFHNTVNDRGMIAVAGQTMPIMRNYELGYTKVSIECMMPIISNDLFKKITDGLAYLVFPYEMWHGTLPITKKGLYIFITDYRIDFEVASPNNMHFEGILYGGEIKNPVKVETKITDPVLKELNNQIEDMTNE